MDPGGDLDRIRAAIAETGITLEKILITHAHIDHAGATAELAESEGVPIKARTATTPSSSNRSPSRAQVRFPGARSFRPTRWLKKATR